MRYVKDMTRKEKAVYIWDYYKFHIIICLAAIIFIVSMAYSQLTKPDYVFNLTYMGTVMDDNKKNNFESELTKLVSNSKDKRKLAMIETFPINNMQEAGQGVNPQLMQKFFAETAVGDIDIVIMDKTNFETLASNGALARLDNINGMDISEVKFDKSDNGVYAINVEDNNKLKAAGFDTKNKVLSVMASSKRKDKAIQIIYWLTKS